MKLFAVLLVLFLVVCGVTAVKKPDPVILHSAYTPFGPAPQQAIDVSGVPKLAAQAKKMGVNTMFVGGSMSEFDTMTVDERKMLIGAWLAASQVEGLYTIVNVGTTVKADAKVLAQYAEKNGADAIATIPPYYNRCPNLPTLVDWLADVASVVKLPLWYYHIPSKTQTTFKMVDLMQMAADMGLDQLTINGGIKYVSSDNEDFLKTANWVAGNSNSSSTILFAPEPKLQGFALQSPWAGAVLAEDFYAPTYLRMRAAYEKGDHAAAIAEQNWKLYSAEAVFNKYGGTAAKRASYQKSCNVKMGNNRSPGLPFNDTLYDALVADLDAIGFWTQAPPSL